MADGQTVAVLHAANRFEAVAAAAMDGEPHADALAALVAGTRAAGPEFAGRVADALAVMIAWIEEDDARRFAPKTAVLRDAAARLRA
ncbi:hypothetical protein [Azospirillum halopraeferens]|uniref:hypothetical protein n=1 Tax=Azospirillum halopraeferens TaxID=34010 RepID=UPI0004034042|nr:hypothetical protein [Azospirillum halopraeferens]